MNQVEECVACPFTLNIINLELPNTCQIMSTVQFCSFLVRDLLSLTWAEGYSSPMSMAQIPVPQPTFKICCGLAPMGAMCSFPFSNNVAR